MVALRVPLLAAACRWPLACWPAAWPVCPAYELALLALLPLLTLLGPPWPAAQALWRTGAGVLARAPPLTSMSSRPRQCPACQHSPLSSRLVAAQLSPAQPLEAHRRHTGTLACRSPGCFSLATLLFSFFFSPFFNALHTLNTSILLVPIHFCRVATNRPASHINVSTHDPI